MKEIRISTALVTVVLTAALIFAVDVLLANSGSELAPSAVLALVCVLIAGTALYLGWQVSRFRDPSTRSQVRNMTALSATRVLAFAQCSIMTGAVLTGAMLGILAFHLTLLAERGALGGLWIGALNALAAVILTVAGLVAQRWCKLPPEEDSSTGPSTGTVNIVS
ncbi:MAG: DUF3180 domain-containing protein [Rothia sp. (in: high G+C Gram-positive bacteria)]|uniref:DUF3180 domain-containing protein n=1 Tax=Rothia sp. (in: high G+C Gram-positive bacteria) TaxID=1885016 RepID=UPI0026E0BD6B|nr:DUF3180 domain-containing protein [Rothia sp. (in: high G+C Gram-positive bacteria)]MDO5749731.1 DUF3180 domain-containing protein [Rothia sp. (in: high G+C Gram-positive bacteria)]